MEGEIEKDRLAERKRGVGRVFVLKLRCAAPTAESLTWIFN